MYDHYFIYLGKHPVPDNLCKVSATRHPRFWRRRFLKVFTIYGHGGHLGQCMATILAIFHSPRHACVCVCVCVCVWRGGGGGMGLQMNLSKTGQEAPEEKSFEILNIFPIQMHREADPNLP